METQEGKTMRLSAGQGSAMLNCEGYTKDREEYDLDQDIERNMGGWSGPMVSMIIFFGRFFRIWKSTRNCLSLCMARERCKKEPALKEQLSIWREFIFFEVGPRVWLL